MNDLQIALLTLGGGAIGLMVVYNWIQDWRVRRQSRQRFEEPLEDALLTGGQRVEPTMHAGAPDAVAGQSLSAQFDEYMLGGGGRGSTGAADDVLDGAAPEPDPRLHALVYIAFDKTVETDLLTDMLAGLHKAGNKPVRLAVLPAEGGSDELWLRVSPGLRIDTLRLAVQLANRKGPLTSIEYSEFVNRLEQFAAAHGGGVELPDMAEIIARAEQLDLRAAALDTLLGMHCVLPESVGVTGVQEQLMQAGWVQAGRQWWLAEGGQALASAVIHETPGKRVLSFSLDVPNAVDPIHALDSIAKIATQIVHRFDGDLMDDAGRNVTPAALKAIHQQLAQRSQQLTDAGFAPGSHASRLLFT
jgi:hypothetical protein